MVYKNFYLRVFSSAILIFLFLSINLYFDNLLKYIFILIYFIIFYEVFINFKYNKSIVFLIFYLFFSLIFLELYLVKYYDLKDFIYYIFAISIFDISSYLGGSIFGKKKILPNLSPGKTYFGLFTGIAIVFIYSIFYNYMFEIYNFNQLIFISIFLILFSFFGDNLESYFKRLSTLKDSSNLIPGHGGFFDRFDSIISCSYFIFFLNYFFNQ